jgi:hypothetical protein
MISLDVALLLINSGIRSLFIERDDDYCDEIERWVDFDDGEINVQEVTDLIIQNLEASNIYEITEDTIIIDFNHRRIRIDIMIEAKFDVFQARSTFI